MSKTRSARPARSARSPAIEVIGADANNLRHIDVTLPLNAVSVVTGVSGSGKSSLLAETLAAEGIRRTRTFLDVAQGDLIRDHVGAFVSPLPPTILVGQRGFRPNVRTTVGTATGFLSVLRRLFVLASRPYSDQAQEHVPPPSPDTYAPWVSRHYRGTVEIWAAPVRNQRTDGVAAVGRLASHGLKQIVLRSETDAPRHREHGRVISSSDFAGVNPGVRHTIETLVATVDVVGPKTEQRLRPLLETAFLASNGSVVVMLPAAVDPELAGPHGPRLDSTRHYVHPNASDVFAAPSQHLLSFNAPEHQLSGACRQCRGTGVGKQLREHALVARPHRTMREGAFAIWTPKNYKYVNIQHDTIEGLRGIRGFSPDVPWANLPTSARALVLDGSGEELIADRSASGRPYGPPRAFRGFRQIILEKSAGRTKAAGALAPYVSTGRCTTCIGTRWSFQARALQVAGHGIADILAMTFDDVESLTGPRSAFARSMPKQVQPLVASLHRHAKAAGLVGLGYLTVDRGMLDVSDGESRRIRLARVLDAGERGFCLLLDEPARGLHESDLDRLAIAIDRLRGRHTVILNTHRERLWTAADWQVDMGPGAGAAGGEVVYAGPVRRRGPDQKRLRTPLPVDLKKSAVHLRGGYVHNIRNVDCHIPLGRLTCICGVSGSGKSSFVRGILAPALLASLPDTNTDFELRSGRWRSVSGSRTVTEVVALDQNVPPPNRRSLVATFSDLFDGIRSVFAASPAAKRAGLSASDFGVNAGRGRCQTCLGAGRLNDGARASICPVCGGSRYGHEALSVRVADVNVQELMDTPVDHLASWGDLFRIPPRLTSAMVDLGLGHLALGRPMDTLSGGEVQRLRLARSIATTSTGSVLFILDEPAVGLHRDDVDRLASALTRVLQNGRNTVVIVEHDLDLIRAADWLVEFGPGGGPSGGQVVFAGTPEQLADARTPTGLAVADRLPATKRRSQVRRPSSTARSLPLDERVARTNALMRTLISGNAAVEDTSDQESLDPVVVLDDHLWLGRESWEIGGLEHEIPKLLLDVQRTTGGNGVAELITTWGMHPGAWLAVHPFLTEMQIWGSEVPCSVARAVVARVEGEALQLVTTTGGKVATPLDIRRVRATGARLCPHDESPDARRRAVADALAVGARYTELRDRAGRLLATAGTRFLDLEMATVAPMTPTPSDFSRLDERGRCPMCRGGRVVMTIPDTLVVGTNTVGPDHQRFLRPEALAVMKGVLRNELTPFLRRLSKEGLWNFATPFATLDRAEREMVLFGFWSRPGAGSFLKRPGANPVEVASWLRWDGLYRRLLDQTDRSRNPDWVRQVRTGARQRRCPRCKGSGLQLFAGLLRVGDGSLAEWVRLGDGARMLDRIGQVAPATARQQRTHTRILHCLAPLRTPGADPSATAKRTVESFTTMPTAVPAAPQP